MRLLLGFSLPLIIGGLGSMVLNAGDRYVLAAFRTKEELAVYTLAAKFGGAVNMFVVQPFNLAWLPLLFRLDPPQRQGVLLRIVPYLNLALCLAVIALCLFADPVLRLMGSAAPYRAALPMLPWLGFGFVAFGLSLVFGGILALFKRTRFLSLWLALSAVLNLLLNLLLVPRFGAMAAALNTLIAYLFLLAGQFLASRKLLPTAYPCGRILGVALLSLVVSFLAARLKLDRPLADWGLRLGLLLGWGLILFAARWVTPAEVRDVWRTMRGQETRG